MMAELWLHYAVPVLLALLMARGLWALVAVELCARWLLDNARRDPVPADEDGPWLVVLLPMLREQTLAPETIATFTALDYPRERAVVVTITTEREENARRRDRDRLAALAGTSCLTEVQLRGMFPRARCGDVADEVNAAPREKRLHLLAELYDAEPTTRVTVAALAEDQPAGGCVWCTCTNLIPVAARPDSSTTLSTASTRFLAPSAGATRTTRTTPFSASMTPTPSRTSAR